jgi:hypothetical protein
MWILLTIATRKLFRQGDTIPMLFQKNTMFFSFFSVFLGSKERIYYFF